jgi:glyoxylase-like metal-dependent hydrolase (beta-lactamase superfamily II)
MPPGPPSPIAGIQIVTAANASPLTLEGTNTYLVGAPRALAIDPGPDDPAHVARVLECARAAGREVALILVTHAHDDHLGAARRLSRETGAPVGRWRAGDEPLEDGHVAAVGEVRLRALHTPGHAPDHLVFLWEERRVLFSGDLVLGSGTVVVRPPGGSMADYLRSLRLVARLDLAAIAPGHGPLVPDPAARLAEYIAHREMRERQVLAALSRGTRTAAEIVEAVYPDLDPRLRPAAEGQVQAHLLKLLEDGRVLRTGSRYRLP